MAKVITGEWQEVLKQVSDCKVLRPPALSKPSQVVFLLQDPMGQRFLLEINAVAAPELVGNLLALNGCFLMRLLEPVAGERFADITF